MPGDVTYMEKRSEGGAGPQQISLGGLERPRHLEALKNPAMDGPAGEKYTTSRRAIGLPGFSKPGSPIYAR